MNLKETELRLGLPGGDDDHEVSGNKNNGKRGFVDTHMDLKLNNLCDSKELSVISKKDDINEVEIKNDISKSDCMNDLTKPPAAKAQVVGWPPVRSSRRNIHVPRKDNTGIKAEKGSNSPVFVKVSMDGAPYLRRVDLNLYKSYKDLSDDLSKMFSSFTIGNCGSQGMNERKFIDLLNGSEYAATYEDKDGDWMLVGDVPWEMFIDSCKRLRIMKGFEQYRKCKNRS